ncbi:PhoH family protein [Alkaliphilus hydrothermalis]|uniref:PhoH-like ATPase n=1 Tax=Alkaliphilus hydrothermalis TaxID=1482730 RepID=A0ABS2NRK4_9FIRM|nr:PhoH family protein [Alkaliphilus hydrothermalis]MBM7615565.1 PhoH-like ATPase [Alkaliphilus hydrothermalis]
MRKTFVLDTSVLLHDPNCIHAFGDNLVVIPAVVIEEIDKKKNLQDIIGRNAREVARELDLLRQEGSLSQGIDLSNKGKLKIELNHKSMNKLSESFSEINNDNRILAVALNFQEEKGKENVILVSKDVIMRIKADSLGIESQDFIHDTVEYNSDEVYKGYSEHYIASEKLSEFYQKNYLEVSILKQENKNLDLFPHQFVLLRDASNPNQTAIAKYNYKLSKLEQLYQGEDTYWGIKGKNLEQRMALEALLDDEVRIVTLTGRAGTGKTLLALVAGLYQTNDLKKYQKLLITKPVIPVGRDIGYLPGDKDEKLRPWVQPIYDNLELILGTKTISKLEDTLVGMNRIEIEAMTYIRGRSIPNQFVIIDEAQNLTKHEIKTLITRVGEGTKIVLMGDTDQIDHPYLDSVCNGLSYTVSKLKEQPMAAHIHFKKVERSTLAQLASEIL